MAEDAGTQSADVAPSGAEVEPAKPRRGPALPLAITALAVAVLALVVGVVGVATGFLGAVVATTSSAADPVATETDVAHVVALADQAVVTVFCGDYAGSGWGIDLADNPQSPDDDAYPYEIVTNYHVVQDCIDNALPITIQPLGATQEFEAKLYNYDASFYDGTSEKWADLALLMTAEPVGTLEPATQWPAVGEWVMAAGSPYSEFFDDIMPGTYTFGHVTNVAPDVNIIITDAAINSGNSGGPLLDSHGRVLGTNTWGDDPSVSDNNGYSIGIPTLCDTVLSCDTTNNWAWK